jgi:hypothetical protein
MTQTEEEWYRCQFCGNPNVQYIDENGKCDKCFKVI